METLLYLISNAIRIYAIAVFTGAFLGKSRLAPFNVNLTYLGYYAIGSTLWLTVHSPTLNLIANTAMLLLLTTQYQTSWLKRLLCAVSSCAMGMFFDWFAFALFGNRAAIECGFLQDIVALIFAFVFKGLYKRYDDSTFKSKYSWFLIVISIGTIIVGMLTVNAQTTHDYIIASVLLIINFLNFYVYNLEQKNLETKHKLRLIEMSNHAYRNQLQILQNSQKKLRFMRHDLRKHFLRIRDMISSESYADIPSYLDEMEEAIIVPQEFSKSGNKDVDSLINYELTLAAEFGTEIHCDVSLPDQLNVTAFDMTVILGNLLDNALEALRHAQEKRLHVLIREKRGIIKLEITNTFDPDYTRAPDGREHGIGLMSVTNTLEKYHGKLETFPKDKEFCSAATFFNKAE